MKLTTAAQMKELDRQAIEERGSPSIDLMERAAAGVAEAAQALLKKRGFVRPDIVVWTAGAARNLSLDPEAAKATYRVEITGTGALSDEVKGVIAATGEVYELSRVGSQLFVVGAFDDRAVADRLAESIRQTDAALEVKVAEIAE